MNQPPLKPRKILSAGIIPVKRTGRLPMYILLRAYTYWDFPKGHVEAGEDPIAGAERELEEETGLKKPAFLWGHEFRETEVYAAGKVARYYIAEVQEAPIILGISPILQRPEHHEFRWCTPDEVRDLVSARVLPIFEWAHRKVLG